MRTLANAEKKWATRRPSGRGARSSFRPEITADEENPQEERMQGPLKPGQLISKKRGRSLLSPPVCKREERGQEDGGISSQKGKREITRKRQLEKSKVCTRQGRKGQSSSAAGNRKAILPWTDASGEEGRRCLCKGGCGSQKEGRSTVKQAQTHMQLDSIGTPGDVNVAPQNNLLTLPEVNHLRS